MNQQTAQACNDGAAWLTDLSWPGAIAIVAICAALACILVAFVRS